MLINEQYEHLKKQLCEAYYLQCESLLGFDFEELEKSDLSKHTFSKLSRLLDECGLGRLNIDEYIFNWKFQSALIKKLGE